MIKSAYLQMSVMELIEEYTKEHFTFTRRQHESLVALWNDLTESGKESLAMWAEENDLTIPPYCK